jgi:hypothetical protein
MKNHEDVGNAVAKFYGDAAWQQPTSSPTVDTRPLSMVNLS